MGCGDRRAGPGWVNCDNWPGVGPDVVMDATERWPFPTGVVERVYLGQVIEHLTYPGGVSRCLGEAARVLRPDGVCCVVCPDFAAHSEKRVPAEVVESERAGMRRWPGDEHRWEPNRHVVGAALRGRFALVTVVNVLNLAASWPPGARNPWDCCFVASQLPPPGIV